MSSCLGLYIEDNLIKYAKVSKNNDGIRVESFGVKFYETLGNAINQIIEETYSFKVPISINTTDEWYNEIQVFSKLSPKDIESVVKTEFEDICDNKDINVNIYEQRHIYTKSAVSQDKIKTIHIAVPKTLIEQRKNQFSSYKVANIVPLSISLADLVKTEKRGTSLIVNIEKETTITKISNGSVSDIKVLDIGSEQILEKINKTENSYAKSYEVCKNSTIYTETDRDLQYEDNAYLEHIMPTLYQIVSEVRKTVDESIENVEKVYITGTGALINNIDIYFQDYLRNIQCEILKPSFLNNNSKINMKDYIEVNSAIAIALQGLNRNSQNINFKSESGFKKAASFVDGGIFSFTDSNALRSMSGALERFSKPVNFLSVILIMTTVLYAAGGAVYNNLMNSKKQEVEFAISDTNSKIQKNAEYEQDFIKQTSKYESLIKSIQDSNEAVSEDKRFKKAIPNLLNNIMTVVPTTVQITSISNPTDTQVKIVAKSKEFKQISYFITKLKTEGILDNVKSDTGKTEIVIEKVGDLTREVSYLIVTIEGDLP